MCTVTFLPARNGFTLTHNRDEAPSRTLYSIEQQQTRRGELLLFPRDASAGGSWIVTAENGNTACLLNGAFVLHKRTPPYRRSRGLMMLDFFDFENPDDFFENYDLDGIEPFTFLFFQPGKVVELRWDGSAKHLKNLAPNEAHFWCSATLYPDDMQQKREQVFRQWLAARGGQRAPDPGALLQLHLTGSVGDPEYDYVMERGGRVRTLSITQVVLRKKITRMRYLDLLEGNRDERLVSRKDR
jgi:Transport and Golgi organisation 2